jgi:hypothetical protein
MRFFALFFIISKKKAYFFFELSKIILIFHLQINLTKYYEKNYLKYE